METSVDAIIDMMGFGKFNRKICFTIGIFYMLDGIEISLITLIGPKLQCDWNMSSFQTALTSSALFFGMGIGAMYWGWLGDKHGRKIMLITSALLSLYFALLTSVSINFVWFLLLRFFVGFGVSGFVSANSYLGEFCGTINRSRIVVATQFFFTLGNVYVAVMAYLSMNNLGWRIFVLLCTIPLPIIILLLKWLPESIRYLQNTGNMDAIMKVLHCMSKENNVPLPKHLNIECQVSKDRGKLSILLKRQYRVRLLVVVILRIVTVCTYFTVALLNTEMLQNQIYHSGITKAINASTDTCHTLTENEYLQNVVVALGELPGFLLCILLLEKLGRKVCLVLGYIFTSGVMLLLLLPLTLTSSTIVLFILKAMMAVATGTLFVYTVELFPTTIRNTAMGFCNGIARWCIIIVPFLVTMLIKSYFTQLIIITSVSSLLCSLLCCLLPETRGLHLKNY